MKQREWVRIMKPDTQMLWRSKSSPHWRLSRSRIRRSRFSRLGDVQNACWVQMGRGPRRMIPAPIRQIAAPVNSHGSGRCFSMIHSQANDDAM